MKIYSPVGQQLNFANAQQDAPSRPRAAQLGSVTRAVIMQNDWPMMHALGDSLAARLTGEREYASVVQIDVPTSAPPSDEDIERAARDGGVVLVGLATCGSCTAWSVNTTSALRKQGALAFTLVTGAYMPAAEMLADSCGLDREALVELPIASASRNVEDDDANVDTLAQSVLQALFDQGSDRTAELAAARS